MRTKTLLLTAALTAVGIATSMAQVYSVNAVGYVKTSLQPGFNLVSNPLTGSDNSIGGLLANIAGGIPTGLQAYKYDGAAFKAVTADEGELLPAANAALTVVPGEGMFIKNPGTTALTITFVGEVSQGALSNPLPKGLSIRSSQVPQAGTAAELGLQGEDGDQVYQYVATTQKYYSSTSDGGEWGPALKTIAVGEAFFLKKAAAGTWTRNFSVNN
jgi:hypothetical protein